MRPTELPAQPGTLTKPMSTFLRAAMQEQVSTGKVTGLVALVSQGDRVEEVALGYRAVGGQPMTRDTIFRIASITKPITAVATMMLVEESVLNLDEPVDELLPELARPMVLRTLTGPVDDVLPASRAITPRDLLTFTAGHGFPSDFSVPVVRLLSERLLQGPPQPQAVPSPQEWMQRLAEIPLLHQPGDGWTYNTGSDILGVLIARASGRSLPDFLAERIFEPLGMVDTGFFVPAAKLDRLATYYTEDPDTGDLVRTDPPTGQWSTMPVFPSGAGGLVSTLDDWLAFGRMLLAEGEHDGHRLLSPASVRAMMTDYTTAAQREYGRVFLQGQGWGFGGSVDINTENPWNVPGRFGWVGGTGTSAYVTPATGTVELMFTQLQMGGPSSTPLLEGFWRAAAELTG